MTGLSFPELLRFNEQETDRWHQFLGKQGPTVLEVTVDLAGGGTVRDLLLHMFAVELKYAERLSGGQITQPFELPNRTVDEIFNIATTAHEKISGYLQTASEADLNRKITFPTLSAGEQTATRRKVLGHALVHSLRHWAQLTTEMRRRGYKADWHHDFLFTDALQ
ncbi:MAG: DinB family protein [Terriglobales bacterium]